MADLNTKQTLWLKKLDGTAIAYDEKIRQEYLGLQYGRNALVEILFRANPALRGGTLKEWSANQAKLIREVREAVSTTDDKTVNFTTFKVDLTKPLEVVMLNQNKLFDNMEIFTGNDALFSNNVALAEQRMRAKIAKDLITLAFNEAKETKLFTATNPATTTNQPSWATTTATTLPKLKAGQKVSGQLTDLFAEPTNANSDYNAFKLTNEAIKQLKKLGTEKSVEKWYPFAENGFGNEDLVIIASSDAREVLRANPAFKTMVMKNALPEGLNEYFTFTGRLNGVAVFESNQLPEKVEILVMTQRALLVEMQEIYNAPFATVKQGEGEHITVNGATVSAKPYQLRMLANGKFIRGVAFPNEIIMLRSA